MAILAARSGPPMGPRHSFWNVLGPMDAPMFGERSSTRAAGRAPRPSTGNAGNLACLIDILGEVNRLAGLCGILFARIREDSGLSGIEVLTLIAIAHSPSPPTVPQVGRSLGHPRQVIQRAVRELENAGLIELAPNPGHKRALLLKATPAGEKLGADIDAATEAIVSVLADGADADALSAIRGGLAALRGRINAYLNACA